MRSQIDTGVRISKTLYTVNVEELEFENHQRVCALACKSNGCCVSSHVCYPPISVRVSREKHGKCRDTHDVGCTVIIGLCTVRLAHPWQPTHESGVALLVGEVNAEPTSRPVDSAVEPLTWLAA